MEIVECNEKEVLVLAGESVIICISLQAAELEVLAKCEWLCSGGAEEWELSALDSIFFADRPFPMVIIVLVLCGTDKRRFMAVDTEIRNAVSYGGMDYDK